MAAVYRTRRPSGILRTCLLVAVVCCSRLAPGMPSDLPEGVSWASVLAEACDLRTLAAPVATNAASRGSSSCLDSNKVLLAYLAPQIWGDMDHGFFQQVWKDPDGVHATLAEFSGPGAVTWVWSANPVGTLSLYVDRREQPVLSMPFKDFLDGAFLPVKTPFAGVTSLGHNLHFPIVHARYCKLVVSVPERSDLSELYYQVGWQALPDSASIHPFDPAAIKQDSRLLRTFSRELRDVAASTEPAPPSGSPGTRAELVLGPGQAQVAFHAAGPQAITCLRVTGASKADLQGLWLDGTWDGSPCVHLPLHMLAGVSANLEGTESYPATVRGRRVVLRWCMPFAAQGTVLCSNAAARACAATVEVWSQPVVARQLPLHFHANFCRHPGIPTAGNTVLTLAETEGPGRFVGCMLSVDSRSEKWWGEGDPIIWLDDPAHEAWHGTGTEDYFGFAWCTRGIFNHPFRGQTMATGDRSHRLASMHRYHLLDRLEFRQWGRFQFEAWGQDQGEMDWMTSVLWYGADHPGVH